MAIDPAVGMALGVHSHKGAYAILLGSGISRSAKIPTGYDVVTDLIRQVAAASGDDAGADPVAWYEANFKRTPSYSDLVAELAPTPTERTSLLKGYFEPTDAEREQGLKTPTLAHQAIARLVARDYIRVIVTTNFDRLIERAIEAEGITPTVLSSSDAVAGMMPLAQVRCLIIKIHGDYLDTRIRNTPKELEKYDADSDELLNRIFTEYGLIVCGWSADWDPALVAAVVRNTRHRFSTYWMARGDLTDRAKSVVNHRKAVLVPIQNADRALVELEERVDALASQRVADPVSPQIALAMAKKFLSTDNYRIQLHDLVTQELNAVRVGLKSTSFPLNNPYPDKSSFKLRTEWLDALSAKLVPIVAAGVYWGTPETDSLWIRCVTALFRQPSANGDYQLWTRLQRYPAHLVAYAAGIVAFLRGRRDWLAALLLTRVAEDDYSEARSLGAQLGAERCIGKDEGQWLYEDRTNGVLKTPGSEWMATRIRTMLVPVFGPDIDLEQAFDDFEFLLSLVSADELGWGLNGAYTWRNARRLDQAKQITQLRQEISTLGLKHPYVAQGLFGGDLDRLNKAIDKVGQIIASARFG